MARVGDQADSQGSQFFLVYEDSTIPSDSAGGYTVFGTITEGLDIVQQIADGGLAEDGTAPTRAVSIEEVTVSERADAHRAGDGVDGADACRRAARPDVPRSRGGRRAAVGPRVSRRPPRAPPSSSRPHRDRRGAPAPRPSRRPPSSSRPPRSPTAPAPAPSEAPHPSPAPRPHPVPRPGPRPGVLASGRARRHPRRPGPRGTSGACGRRATPHRGDAWRTTARSTSRPPTASDRSARTPIRRRTRPSRTSAASTTTSSRRSTWPSSGCRYPARRSRTW